MNITSVLRKLFIARQRELAHYTYEAEKLQHDVLMRLVEQAKDTEYGRKHLFAAIKGYDVASICLLPSRVMMILPRMFPSTPMRN